MIPKKKIRVGIVERNCILRRRLADTVRSQKDMLLAFSTSAHDCDDRLAQADVLLSAWETLSRHSGHQGTITMNGCRIIVTGADPHQDGFACCIRRGASGFVLPDSTEVDILAAIRAVMKGAWEPAALRMLKSLHRHSLPQLI